MAIILPFLLGNQDCQRSTTWGNGKKLVVDALTPGHPDVDAKTDCSGCHENVSKLKPAAHNLTWKRDHGKYAQLSFGFKAKNLCTKCHTEATCTKCHQQEAPKSHTQHWRLKGHGLMMGLDRDSCATCHTTDTCDRCHANTRPASHNSLWGSTQNRHCLSCHSPISGSTAEQCGFCHATNSSHSSAPDQPANAFHATGAVCRSCHAPLVQHADNGEDCDSCHD